MKILSIWTTEYAFRKLFLVKFSPKTKQTLYCAFYKSAGLSDPARKNGDIFPILGICDEGHLGRDIRRAYVDAPTGWIAKGCSSHTKGKYRDSLESYYNIPFLRELSLELESYEHEHATPKCVIQTLGFEEFVHLLDALYCDENMGNRFFSRCLRVEEKEVKA